MNSSVVTLQVDEKPISIFCHMGDFRCGDGGWTPVMKIHGNKVNFAEILSFLPDYPWGVPLRLGLH